MWNGMSEGKFKKDQYPRIWVTDKLKYPYTSLMILLGSNDLVLDIPVTKEKIDELIKDLKSVKTAIWGDEKK